MCMHAVLVYAVSSFSKVENDLKLRHEVAELERDLGEESHQTITTAPHGLSEFLDAMAVNLFAAYVAP